MVIIGVYGTYVYVISISQYIKAHKMGLCPTYEIVPISVVYLQNGQVLREMRKMRMETFFSQGLFSQGLRYYEKFSKMSKVCVVKEFIQAKCAQVQK